MSVNEVSVIFIYVSISARGLEGKSCIRFVHLARVSPMFAPETGEIEGFALDMSLDSQACKMIRQIIPSALVIRIADAQPSVFLLQGFRCLGDSFLVLQ